MNLGYTSFSYLKQLTSNLVCTKTTFKTNLNLKHKP